MKIPRFVFTVFKLGMRDFPGRIRTDTLLSLYFYFVLFWLCRYVPFDNLMRCRRRLVCHSVFQWSHCVYYILFKHIFILNRVSKSISPQLANRKTHLLITLSPNRYRNAVQQATAFTHRPLLEVILTTSRFLLSRSVWMIHNSVAVNKMYTLSVTQKTIRFQLMIGNFWPNIRNISLGHNS